MFQGAEYQRNLDFVDSLRPIASDADLTVSQLVIAWTLAQPGISVALCGGRRPEQILTVQSIHVFLMVRIL